MKFDLTLLIALGLASNCGLALSPQSSPTRLLELDITLVLHKRRMPWHILDMVCQLSIELAVCRAIKRHTLKLAIAVSLIGIKEPNEQCVLGPVYMGLSEVLTEIPEQNMLHQQHRSRMPRPIFPCPDPASTASAQ